jgi:hypothetical protein
MRGRNYRLRDQPKNSPKNQKNQVMDDARQTWQPALARTAGIVFGAGTQVGFLITVWYLFFFLKDGVPSSESSWLAADLLLALQFALIHSLLLHPRVRVQLTKFVPTTFYGCLFCVATCCCLAQHARPFGRVLLLDPMGWHCGAQAPNRHRRQRGGCVHGRRTGVDLQRTAHNMTSHLEPTASANRRERSELPANLAGP